MHVFVYVFVCVTCSIINEAILITSCTKKLGRSYEQCKSSHMLGWGFPDMCMCVCVYVSENPNLRLQSRLEL